MNQNRKIPKLTDNRLRLIVVLAILAVAVVAILAGKVEGSAIMQFLTVVMAWLIKESPSAK